MSVRRGGVRWAELAIAALVLAVVVMLIVPVPRPLLDGLLALNIAISVALLMAAVFTGHPIGFASFPMLLVVTTLFRVGLEVSTTRLCSPMPTPARSCARSAARSWPAISSSGSSCSR